MICRYGEIMEQEQIDLSNWFVKTVNAVLENRKEKLTNLENAAINGNYAVKCEDQFAAQVKIRR